MLVAHGTAPAIRCIAPDVTMRRLQIPIFHLWWRHRVRCGPQPRLVPHLQHIAPAGTAQPSARAFGELWM